MIVCSCNVLSDRDVKGCLADAACPRTPAQVHACLGCSPKCGRCARTIRAIMANALHGASGHACGTACAESCSLVQFQSAREDIAA